MYWLAIQVILFAGSSFGLASAPVHPAFSGISSFVQAARKELLGCRTRDSLSAADFEAVMKSVGDGRQHGNARKAADCFTENAIYSSPPSAAHVGRENLFQLFGSDDVRAIPYKIEWHHFVFDPEEQVGVAEFTLQFRVQVHGMVIVKISHGLISNWREYDVPSGLSWSKFVGMNEF
jgi:hypothetical protein